MWVGTWYFMNLIGIRCHQESTWCFMNLISSFTNSKVQVVTVANNCHEGGLWLRLYILPIMAMQSSCTNLGPGKLCYFFPLLCFWALPQIQPIMLVERAHYAPHWRHIIMCVYKKNYRCCINCNIIDDFNIVFQWPLLLWCRWMW